MIQYDCYIAGNLSIIKSLVQNGADIKAKNNVGWSALHFSSRDGNWKCFLLENKYTENLIEMI